MKKVISTPNAPAAIGPYSQAIEVDNLVFVSGQIPVDPVTGKVADDVKSQAKQSLTNVKNILSTAGLNMGNIVKTTVFLANIADFVAVNEVYASFFEGAFPARSAVAVKDLPKGVKLEIEAIAAK
jgi:2-iminobutanoate/2-iminopropanoate deaminase